jgi:cobalamin biosynthesis protein CbiD
VTKIEMSELWKRKLCKVLNSKRVKTNKWLRHKADKDLLTIDPKFVNNFFYSLIEEYKKEGFDEKVALSALGKLRKLKELGLPVNINTLSSNLNTLQKRQKELERLGLPVNSMTIGRNPETLQENKKELERRGLPINTNTICFNPNTVAKKFQRKNSKNKKILKKLRNHLAFFIHFEF